MFCTWEGKEPLESREKTVGVSLQRPPSSVPRQWTTPPSIHSPKCWTPPTLNLSWCCTFNRLQKNYTPWLSKKPYKFYLDLLQCLPLGMLRTPCCMKCKPHRKAKHGFPANTPSWVSRPQQTSSASHVKEQSVKFNGCSCSQERPHHHMKDSKQEPSIWNESTHRIFRGNSSFCLNQRTKLFFFFFCKGPSIF